MRGPLRLMLGASPRVLALNAASPATRAYIAAVEAADGARLEPAVLSAMVSFANWRIPLGGACCILAGARTLSGALVPLVGPAPTGINLVAGDYDRRRLQLNGTTKAVNTNYSNNSMPQNSRHAAVNLFSAYTGNPSAANFLVGSQASSGHTTMWHPATNNIIRAFCSDGASQERNIGSNVLAPGLFGVFRSASSSYDIFIAGTAEAKTSASVSPADFLIHVGSSDTPGFFSAIATNLYSAGPHINSSDLNSRTVSLTSALATALP